MFEKIRIIKRVTDPVVLAQLLALDLDPLVAKIIAGRPFPEHPKKALGVFDGRLADLSSPFLMRDMDKAAERLCQAILNQEVIAIETDHDCDGQTSHAVIMTALRGVFYHPADKIQSYIGHRLQEGYGLSDALCNRMLAHAIRPNLVITADNGSSDEARIARLKAAGIDVIVTDHHAIPAEGIPQSAYACLNPTRPDCGFPDPYIAGCMVAWLLMAATRRLIEDQKKLPNNALPMRELLDFVAVGTVADCVSLARSLNNRVIVQYGLKKINQFHRPCWQALRPLLRNVSVTVEDLGFLLGPLLNSDGRLSDALSSVNFLLTETVEEASILIQGLFEQNEERKRIQKELSFDALKIAKNQVMSGKVSLVIYLEEGHPGVHGISASRIKDQFGRPVIIFSPKQNEEGIVVGSCRSIDSVHVRDVLQVIDDEFPGMMLKFGGHKAAAGLSLRVEDLPVFANAFERGVAAALKQEQVGPILITDGLWEGPLTPARLIYLRTLEPFGREFEEPLFESHVTLKSARRFGKAYNHMELLLQFKSGEVVKGIWFNALEEGNAKVEEGSRLHIVFSLPLYQKNKVMEVNVKYVAEHRRDDFGGP